MSIRAARVLAVAAETGSVGPVRRISPRGCFFVAVPHSSRRVHGLLEGRAVVEWICHVPLRAALFGVGR